jgi:Fe-S cluster assembly scaffold protein SufB
LDKRGRCEVRATAPVCAQRCSHTLPPVLLTSQHSHNAALIMNKKIIQITQLQNDPIIITDSGEYVIELAKSGAEVVISGVFLAERSDVVDVTVIVHHKAPNTRAETVLKGVGRDRARIRFVGRIIIDPDCGNSNSFLTERILLLSDEAKAETIPDLEILTDDVKCSHAASISRIPEEQIFYLMSRGMSRKSAESLIIEGFLTPHST